MRNGFYNTENFDTKEKIVDFIKDAIMFSYRIEVQSKYKKKEDGDRGWRETDTESSVDVFLSQSLKTENLKVVNRNIYNKGTIPSERYGEISLGNFDKGYWQLLYCFLSLDNLEALVAKHNLKLIEY